MSKQQWYEACNSAVNDPQLEAATTAWGAVVGGAFAVCAAASGSMFVRWLRLNELERAGVWQQYGWFTALMCAGCVAAAVSYVVWSRWLAEYHASDRSNVREEHVAAAVLAYGRGLRWLVAYAVTFPFTLCCLVVTKLLVLDRMMEFCKLGMHASACRLKRAAVAAIVLGCAAGWCGNVAASASFIEAAGIFDGVSNTRNISDDASRLRLDAADALVARGAQAAAVLFAFETLMLLSIVVAIFFVGLTSARRIRDALHAALQASPQEGSAQTSHAAAAVMLQMAVEQGRSLQLQIVITSAAIFSSFLLRAAYTSLFTVASALQNSDIKCGSYSNRCSSCYNAPSHVLIWLLYTPAFHFGVVIASGPLAMLVALWGMTSGRTLAAMQESSKRRACGEYSRQ